MSIRAVVDDYIKRGRPIAARELQAYKDKPDIKSAIESAAMALDYRGKRFSHQRRLRRTVLEVAKNTLIANIDAIEKSEDFDQLFDLIEGLLTPLHGVGELYIYDTAAKIGAKLNLMPKLVYLHAGTREGARALGFSGKEKSIEQTRFPQEFLRLEPYEIEDVLCVYKEILRKEKIIQKSTNPSDI
jgi:hypothetical protein